MNLRTNVSILGLLFASTIFCQKIRFSDPPSYSLQTKGFQDIPATVFDSLDTEKLIQQDEEFPFPLRYGVCRNLSVDLKKAGLCNKVNNGTIWRYQLESKGAKDIALALSSNKLPEGAGIWLYNSSHQSCFGAITPDNFHEEGRVTTSVFPGDKLIIEYFEPDSVLGNGTITIDQLIHSYRDISLSADGNSEKVFSPEFSTRCPNARPFWILKHAVCKYTYNDGRYAYTCTGFLVNNSSNDGAPFFVTANHCVSSLSFVSSTTVVAYFNYEIESCDVSGIQARSLSGAAFVYTIKDADFTLLKLKDNPGPEYQPVFAGWDISDSAYYPVSAIHHPDGQAKSLAISTRAVQNYAEEIQWNNADTSPVNSHWRVDLTRGTTIPGSSGCPLFDKNGRAIGQLHGGDSQYDFFGKLSYAYSLDPNKFRQHLDPLNTGSSTLDAYIPSGNNPEPYFSPNMDMACLDAPVTLKNESIFNPGAFQWKIYYKGSETGYSFASGTGNTSREPIVKFSNTGYYSLKLTVGKTAKLTDSTTRTAVLFVSNSINAGISEFPVNNDICGIDLDKAKIAGKGADHFDWTLGDGKEKVDLLVDSNRLCLSLKPDMERWGSFTLPVQLIASHGECSTTFQRTLKIHLAANNEPGYAIELNEGENGSFTNKCATASENEPCPPLGDCAGQLSWCGAQAANGLQNSVWFTVVGPQTGKLGIVLKGMDAQMALYEAGNESDLMQNPEGIKLLAANDNTATGNEPEITPLQVIPGKQYWLQVDGGNGGEEGDFSLTILSDEIRLFPNPNAGKFILNIGKKSAENAGFEIFDFQGRCLLTSYLGTLPGNEKVPVDISTFPAGLYFLNFSSSRNNVSFRILKMK